MTQNWPLYLLLWCEERRGADPSPDECVCNSAGELVWHRFRLSPAAEAVYCSENVAITDTFNLFLTTFIK